MSPSPNTVVVFHCNCPGIECKRSALFAAIGLTVTYIMALGCSQSGSNPSNSVRPPRAQTLAGGKRLDVRKFTGKFVSSKHVELSFDIPGVLIRIPVKEGQKIAKGSVIAQLRIAEFQARLEALQGQLSEARILLNALRRGETSEQQLLWEAQERVAALKLANARMESNRYAGLVESGAASRSEFELAKTNYRIAQEDHETALRLLETGRITRAQQIQSQEAAVLELSGLAAQAKLQVEDSTLRAPYDGFVVRQLVAEGQALAADKPVVQFESADATDIVVYVPEATIASDICSASVVAIHANIGGDPQLRYPARVKEVARMGDPITQTFAVRFAIDSPSGLKLVAGTAVTIVLTYRVPALSDAPSLLPVSSACDPGAAVK